jgi:hypothetical protein
MLTTVGSATKTTFILADSRRARLKALAVERGTTVTELIAEGADLVLAKYQGLADAETLRQRAQQARERLRAGLFDGPGVSAKVNDIVYPKRSRRPRNRK